MICFYFLYVNVEGNKEKLVYLFYICGMFEAIFSSPQFSILNKAARDIGQNVDKQSRIFFTIWLLLLSEVGKIRVFQWLRNRVIFTVMQFLDSCSRLRTVRSAAFAPESVQKSKGQQWKQSIIKSLIIWEKLAIQQMPVCILKLNPNVSWYRENQAFTETHRSI